MDIEKQQTFLRKHWPAVIIAFAIAAPATWTLAYQQYSLRIELLESNTSTLRKQVDKLSVKVAVLEEYKKRTSEKKLLIKPNEIEFDFENAESSLFTSSQPRIIQ